ASYHEACPRLVDDAKGGPLTWILAEAVPDGGRARREGQKAPGVGDHVAIGGGARHLLRRDITLPDHVVDAEGDQVSVPGSVGHVARGQEDGGGVAPTHRAQSGWILRQGKSPRRAVSALIGRRQEHVLPRGVVVTVVPRDVLFDHAPGGGMDRHVLDEPLSHDPHPASIVQSFAILAARPHRLSLALVALAAPGAYPISTARPAHAAARRSRGADSVRLRPSPLRRALEEDAWNCSSS